MLFLQFCAYFVFKVNYDDAKKYVHKRRCGAPAVYNAERDLEEPIPDLGPEVKVGVERNDTDVDANESAQSIAGTSANQTNEMNRSVDQQLNRDGNMEELTDEPNVTPLLVLIEEHNEDEQADSKDGSFENASDALACAIENDLSTQVQLTLKVEPRAEDEIILNELIFEEEYTVEKVDDMEIIVNKKMGFAKPFGATTTGLIKRENDVISGNTPFDELVKIDEFQFKKTKK